MAVTDLTGTTWVFNSILSMPSNSISNGVNIEFNSNNISCVYLRPQTLYDPDDLDFENPIPYMRYASLNDGLFKVYEDGVWTSEAYRTITFTGDGEVDGEVSNAELIAWLEANAVQQVARNDYFTCTDELKSIADAIRTKGGTSASLTYPSGFITAINNLPTKVLGAGTISGYDSPFDIQVTAEDYSGGDWEGFSSVSINISTPFYDGSCDIINPVSLISFMVRPSGAGNNMTYEAEDGMTWAEWIASEYNTGSFYITGSNIGVGLTYKISLTSVISGYVNINDNIIKDHLYYAIGGGSN